MTASPRNQTYSQRPHVAVSHEVERIAARLIGPVLEFAITSDLPTQGLARGSVRRPPSAQPIIHPPTGAYPAIGVIAAKDVPLLAQCPPGTRIRW
jgi:allophanate hydrolase subunit 2